MLFSIMELQLKAELERLTADEQAELDRLQTDWSNASIAPSECPSRPDV